MMRALFVLCIFMVLSANGETPQQSQGKWQEEMQKMKEALTSLLGYASDVETFNAPKNAVAIEGLIGKLKSNSKAIQLHKGKFEGAQDPTIEFVSDAFENNLDSIQRSTSKGRRDYARFLILNTTAYCMECHTRTKSGPGFISLVPDRIVLGLDPVERVEYLISVRQFREALRIIEQTLKEDKENGMFGNEKLIRYGLTLSVKYFQDLDEALGLVMTGMKLKHFPYFLKADLDTWKESLQELKKQKVPTSIDEKIEKAGQWIEKAKSLNVNARSSHAGDIYLLRTNAVLLELFKGFMTKNQKSKALFLTGESYRMLPEHGVWTLHESYYESCIRLVPRTLQAEQCYRALEDSILMGYTGSSGTHLPLDLVDKLKTLKKLSIPLAEEKNN